MTLQPFVHAFGRVPKARWLLNQAEVEWLPAWLLRARRLADQRQLSRALWLARRKYDGRYLGSLDVFGHWYRLPHGAMRGSLPDIPWQMLDPQRLPAPARALSLRGIRTHLAVLGLDAARYAGQTGLAMVAEPSWLAWAGFDRYRRPLWLSVGAARAWQSMQAAAGCDGIVLDAISGYRSHAYQLGIFRRKLARGQSLAAILQVNAAPGFSEHHSGHALDIGTPGEAAAEQSFEETAAFAWLVRHAGRFGFHMSYPRNNPHGVVYEPWHWCWHAVFADGTA